MTPRESVRAALLARDNISLAKCIILFDTGDEAIRVAEEELDKLDYGTKAWWVAPCDSPTSEAEDAVTAVTELLREGKIP